VTYCGLESATREYGCRPMKYEMCSAINKLHQAFFESDATKSKKMVGKAKR
jgi:hypothetical protein